jgi:hypothetical protein
MAKKNILKQFNVSAVEEDMVEKILDSNRDDSFAALMRRIIREEYDRLHPVQPPHPQTEQD